MTKQKAKPEFEIWAEGYATNGERSGATRMGTARGHNFEEACAGKFKGDPHFDTQTLRYWGCLLFDNEADARVSYG